MKKILIIASLCLIAGLSDSFAQSRLGANFAYGTDIEEFGIGINGEFFLKSDLAIAPGFNYYFTEDPITFWEMNANVNYYFVSSGSAALYGLGGINLSTVSVDLPEPFDNSSTELGLNLGIGANFDINSTILPYTQLRLVLGDNSQAVLSFGVKFGI